MKQWIPWWAKILIKIVLSRIPLNYRLWSELGIFRHGNMADAGHALNIFHHHFDRVATYLDSKGFSVLELGVGDSVATAQIAHAFGASNSYLVDVGKFATEDMGYYQRVTKLLKSKGLDPVQLDPGDTLNQMLSHCHAQYMIDGLSSLTSIVDDSVDFVWSEAVLEHVRLSEFDQTLAELHRITRADGVLSHRIDLRDHLDYSLNNLRFSESVWESEFMAGSGFYTNRIRYSDMIDRFESAGFSVEVVVVDTWSDLPTSRSRLNQVFRLLPDDELLVSCFDVILRPIKPSGGCTVS